MSMLAGGLCLLVFIPYDHQIEEAWVLKLLGLGVTGGSLLPLAESFTDRLIVTEQQLYFRKSFRSVTVARVDVAEVKWIAQSGLVVKTDSDRWISIPSWHVDTRSVESSLREWADAV